jgi:Major Facilitator Superfamily
MQAEGHHLGGGDWPDGGVGAEELREEISSTQSTSGCSAQRLAARSVSATSTVRGETFAACRVCCWLRVHTGNSCSELIPRTSSARSVSETDSWRASRCSGLSPTSSCFGAQLLADDLFRRGDQTAGDRDVDLAGGEFCDQVRQPHPFDLDGHQGRVNREALDQVGCEHRRDRGNDPEAHGPGLGVCQEAHRVLGDLDLTQDRAGSCGQLSSGGGEFDVAGRADDMRGRRRMVVIGVIGFAIASACCGLTPKGSIAQAWIITFRVLQGATAALLFPAAVGIVVASFPLRERGRAMAIFFGIAGGLTAIGPIAGGYLTQWTWRSIFWINIPVAIIALLLIRRSCKETEIEASRLDYRGTVLITAMGLIVLGLEQSSVWGWSSPATWVSLIIGVLLMATFVWWELRTPDPLLRLQIFADAGSRPTPPCPG